MWKIEFNANQIAAGFPKTISSTFSGLPDYIDAALYNQADGTNHYFKVNRKENQLQPPPHVNVFMPFSVKPCPDTA